MERSIIITITEHSEIPEHLQRKATADCPPGHDPIYTHTKITAEGFTAENTKTPPVALYQILGGLFRVQGVPLEVGVKAVQDAIVECARKAWDSEAEARDEAKAEEVLKQSMGG